MEISRDNRSFIEIGEIQMKKEKGITLVALAVTIIILIILAGVSINMLVGDNGIIKKAQQAKEETIFAGQQEQEQLNQLFEEMEEAGNGIGTGGEGDSQKDEIIELLQKQVEELKTQVVEKENTIQDLQNQWGEIETQLGETNAEAKHILKDYKAYSKGQLIIGTMTNNEAVNTNLNAGQSYTIPEGYHNGSGKVTANSLASQTQGTATTNNISSGMTAWVNGQLITGNGTDVTNSYNNGYNKGYEEGIQVGSDKKVTIISQYGYGTTEGNVEYYISDVTYDIADVSTVILGGLDTSYGINWAYTTVYLYRDGSCIFSGTGSPYDNGVSNQAIINACANSYDVSNNSTFRIVTKGRWQQKVGIKNIRFQ